MFFIDIGSQGITSGERVTWSENRYHLESLKVAGVRMAGCYDGVIRMRDSTIEISPFVIAWKPSEPPGQGGEGI